MSTAKYNARIKLGFSRTVLVPLRDVKVDEEEDILSDTKSPMTDGCGTATYAVLQAIAEQLGLDYCPSYFQTRHGGRKGLIVLDAENSDAEFHKSLFIIILSHNGVPKEVLGDLAKEAIEKDEIWELLEQGDESSFIKSLYQTITLKERREKDGCFKHAGSMPISAEERIIQMVDAGFTVSECVALKNLVSGCNKNRLESWEGMKFVVPESTSVKCIPDFKKVLKLGEVFLQFSSDGFAVNDKFLKFLRGKVLVGRAPAYLASDIQAAVAVTSPEVLEAYKDFADYIVFPTASDRTYVAKERVFEEAGIQDMVGFHLKNNGMDEDATIKDILKAEIPKMLSNPKVRKCTLMHQQVSYHLTIDDPLSRRLAELACLLFDAPKQGLALKTEAWGKIEHEVHLFLKNRSEPFYMRDRTTYSRFLYENQNLEKTHVLDYVKGTILAMKEDYETKFKAKFSDIFTDNDISNFFSEELEYHRKAARESSRRKHALGISKEIYEELLSFTKRRLDDILRECSRMYSGLDFKHLQTQSENDKENDKANKEKLFAMFQEIEPSTQSGNPVLEDWKRSGIEPFGKWNLLKVSALFRRCSTDKRKLMLPFTVACLQLCYLKASVKGGPFRIVQKAAYLNMYTRSKRLSVKGVGGNEILEPLEESEGRRDSEEIA
ncbi:uncharacterized protein DFL_005557 [Arthrobotrys flagrans]|uniref:RNA-dependent RNA polymerase n=1 Tax=Arthrobotrys flagrans TaxID=97331 RepID=A0A436ZXU4_ARTFL|nr:hypothetical protein DFL_005557 [Arthrobotrys flagrans]